MIFDDISAYIVVKVFRLVSQLLWYEIFGFDPRANELPRRHAVVFYKSQHGKWRGGENSEKITQARIMIAPLRQTAE